MPDNSNGPLWDAIVKAIWGNSGSVPVEQLASTLLSRHDGLLHEGESFEQFKRRLFDLLQAKGMLDGATPGASLRAISTRELRKLAGVSDDVELDEAAEQEALALSLEGATLGNSAYPRGRSEKEQAEEDNRAALSLIDAASNAAAEEALADILCPLPDGGADLALGDRASRPATGSGHHTFSSKGASATSTTNQQPSFADEERAASVLAGSSRSGFGGSKQTESSQQHQEGSPFPQRHRRTLSRGRWSGTARDAGPRRRVLSRPSQRPEY
jgi:hypothetical protein